MSTIWTIARNTVGEAIRKKILIAFILLGLLLIVVSLLFGYFSPREQLVIVKSVSFFAIWFFGILITVILCVQMIPTEVERRTLYTILCKPVRRSEFLIGKFLGAALTVLIATALMGFVFFVVVLAQMANAATEGPVAQFVWVVRNWRAWPVGLFMGVFSTYLMLLLICALGLFLSVVVTPFLNFLLTLFVTALGHLSETLRQLASSNRSEFIKFVLEWMQRIVPDMAQFNAIHSQIIHPEAERFLRVAGVDMAKMAVYAVVYTIILVALGVYAFEKREV
jgi:ABC-type transport system involved in multi-copper enzyme maturation permease subunit